MQILLFYDLFPNEIKPAVGCSPQAAGAYSGFSIGRFRSGWILRGRLERPP